MDPGNQPQGQNDDIEMDDVFEIQSNPDLNLEELFEQDGFGDLHMTDEEYRAYLDGIQDIPTDPSLPENQAHDAADGTALLQGQVQGYTGAQPGVVPQQWQNQGHAHPQQAAVPQQSQNDLPQGAELPPAVAYAGPMIHGTLEQYRYGLLHHIDPRQYGQNWHGPWQGPPLDQVNYEIAMNMTPPQDPAAVPLVQSAPPVAPFYGSLDRNPEWWGSFIDDSARQPREPQTTYTLRVRRARSNMQIATRPMRPLLPRRRDKQTADQHAQQREEHDRLHDRLSLEHTNKMDPSHPTFDPGYVHQWREDKLRRRAVNDQRRQQELDYVRREFANRGLEPPPTPGSPEDSGDELYPNRDFIFLLQRTGHDIPMYGEDEADDENFGEDRWESNAELWTEYRTRFPANEYKPCVQCRARKKRCTFKEKRFPCDFCTYQGIVCTRQLFTTGQGRMSANVNSNLTSVIPQLYLPSLATRQEMGINAPRSWKIGDDPVIGTTSEPLRMSFGGRRRPRRPRSEQHDYRNRPANRRGRYPPNTQLPNRPPVGRPDESDSLVPCNRCQELRLFCDNIRPCLSCINGGLGQSCHSSYQDQPIIEGEVRDDDHFVGGGNNYDNLPMYDGDDGDKALALLLRPVQQAISAAQNITSAIAAGPAPFVAPLPDGHSLAGTSTLPVQPRATPAPAVAPLPDDHSLAGTFTLPVRSRAIPRAIPAPIAAPLPDGHSLAGTITLPIRPRVIQGGGLTLPRPPVQGEHPGWNLIDGRLVPVQPTSADKRPAPENDDGAAADGPPPKRRRRATTDPLLGKPKKPVGTAKGRELIAKSGDTAGSQVNRYNPGNSSLIDPLVPDRGDDDAMDLDGQPPRQLMLPPLPPRGPQDPFREPTWRMWGYPTRRINYFSTGGPGAGDRDKTCNQDQNAWTLLDRITCGLAPAKDCEDVSDNRERIDQFCHIAQEIMSRNDESRTIESSKLFCCDDCHDYMQDQARAGAEPQLRRQLCDCAYAMSRTWLCHTHRQTAHQQFRERIAVQWEAYIRNDRSMCPNCRVNPIMPGTMAWQCVACEGFVFRNPVAV